MIKAAWFALGTAGLPAALTARAQRSETCPP